MSFEQRPLSDDVSVSPQIELEDIAEINAAGFKSVIINRPDNEGPGQPLAADMMTQLKENGLEAINLPMTPGQLTPDLVQNMASALEDLPKPILAYCASGTRSAVLWCCANTKEMGADAVLEAASNVGYDLEQIRPLLNQLSQ